MGIFDQIKNAFSRTDEEPAKRVSTPEPAAEPAAEAEPQSSAVAAKTYTVQSGDTLWKIAEEEYGDGKDYQKIFEANRNLLQNPDHILPGQELIIP